MKLRLAIREHIPWRERIDMDEVEAISDGGFDDLLEAVEPLRLQNPCSPQEVGTNISVRRTPLNTGQVRRHEAAKTTNNWDEEFSNAQNHARSLLANLGK